MSRRFRIFAGENSCQLFQEFKKMNSDTLTLIFVWFIGVVAFFALWAILLKVIKRISERKSRTDELTQKESDEKEISPEQES